MAIHLRPSRLVPFRLATEGEVVGTHDGSRSTLHLGALDDEVVYHHEYGHEVLFTRTLDGAILAFLWGAVDDPRSIARDRLAMLSVTANTLAESSLVAQETFATYYGIKLVDPEVGNGYIDHLPADYRTYYQTAATVIDPLFGSTFMQVRVALTLSHLAFESRFAARFVQKPWNAYREQREDEQPTWRLKALLDDLSVHGDDLRRHLLDGAQAFFEREQVAAWDLNDEAKWHDQPALANRLDLELDQCMASWLGARRVVPVLTVEERSNCVQKLASFAGELGLRFRESIGRTTGPAEIANLDPAIAHIRHDSATRTHAWKQAGSLIANPTVGRTLPAAYGKALWEVDDYRLADKLVVVAGDPNEHSELWTVLRVGPQGASTNLNLGNLRVSAVHYHRDDVVDWLNRLLPGQGWTGPQPDLIIMPVGSERRAGKRAFSYGATREPGHIDPWHNDRMALYVMSNWFDFIEAAAASGGVRIAEVSAEVSGYGDQPQPLQLKFARCEAFPGPWFFRALSQKAAASAFLLELDWQDNPAIQSVDEASLLPGDSAEDLLSRAIGSILAFWSRF